jgi:hypothetical protein
MMMAGGLSMLAVVGNVAVLTVTVGLFVLTMHIKK